MKIFLAVNLGIWILTAIMMTLTMICAERHSTKAAIFGISCMLISICSFICFAVGCFVYFVP